MQVGARLPLDARAGGRVPRAFLAPIIRRTRRFAGSMSTSPGASPTPRSPAPPPPLLDADRRVVGALILSAPTARRGRDWLESLRPLVLATADRAYQAIGGPGLPITA